MSPVWQLVQTTAANNTQGDAIQIHDGIGYSPRQYTSSDNFTTQVLWKDSSPPIIGLPIVLSANVLNSIKSGPGNNNFSSH